MFPAFFRLYYGSLAHSMYKRHSHICNSCGLVKSAFFFHLSYDMLQHALFVVIKLKLLQYHTVAFCKLAGCKSERNLRRFCMILNQVHYTMQASVYSAAVLLRTAEIRTPRFFLILCHMYGMIYKFAYSFIFSCRYRHHRNTQSLFHLVDKNSTSVFSDLVHHIKGKHHGYVQLHKLHCQIKVSLYI